MKTFQQYLAEFAQMTPPGAMPAAQAPGQPQQPTPKAPSQVGTQVQQTMQALTQMMQQQNTAGIVKQLPGFIQILSNWQRELQVAGQQRPQVPQQMAQPMARPAS